MKKNKKRNQKLFIVGLLFLTIIIIIFLSFYIKNKSITTSTDAAGLLRRNIIKKQDCVKYKNLYFDYIKVCPKDYKDMWGDKVYKKIGAYSDEFGTCCSLRELGTKVDYLQVCKTYSGNSKSMITNSGSCDNLLGSWNNFRMSDSKWAKNLKCCVPKADPTPIPNYAKLCASKTGMFINTYFLGCKYFGYSDIDKSISTSGFNCCKRK